MEHFVGYHSVEGWGPYDARWSTHYTERKYREETLVDNALWVIEGAGTPKKYRILRKGIITKISFAKGRPGGFDIHFRIDGVDEPIEVTNFDWFRKLKGEQQNFRRGLSRIADETVVRELESLWKEREPSDSVAVDILAIENDTTIDKTTRRLLIEARLGQGRFRNELKHRWKNACAVTGCELSAVLRASHMKPWRSCSSSERLDPDNGLLLAAHLDALFDKGFISFRYDGRMLVSTSIDAGEIRRLQLGGTLSRKLTKSEKEYLRHHRETEFQRR